MLHLFEGLTSTENLTRFSFTDFQGCSIATVILLLGGIIDGQEGDCNAKASFGLECLRHMTGGNTTALMGVRFVEALQSIANEAAAKLAAQRNAQDSTFKHSSTSAPADYAQWTEWLTKATDHEAEQGLIPSQPRTPHNGPAAEIPRNPQSSFMTEGSVRSTLDPGAAANAANVMAEWEETLTAGTSQASVQYPIQVDESLVWQTAAQTDPMLSTEFQLSLNNDGHLYLMGLTGLDVLNFDVDMSQSDGFL
jgi:hypothetical protein